MQKDIEITLVPEEIDNITTLKKSLSQALKIDAAQIKGYKILKRSIDARSRIVIY